MQVRQILIASLLAVGAAGAMSQEIDRSETLQAKNLAARQMPSGSSVSRQMQAGGEMRVEEQAAGLPVAAAPNVSWAKWRTNQDYAKAWLHGDNRRARKVRVAEHG